MFTEPGCPEEAHCVGARAEAHSLSGVRLHLQVSRLRHDFLIIIVWNLHFLCKINCSLLCRASDTIKLQIHLSGVHRGKYAKNVQCGICAVVFPTEIYLKVGRAAYFYKTYIIIKNLQKIFLRGFTSFHVSFVF